MSDIIDKVKEKAKDAKDKVVDNTKDGIDATKESFSASSQSSKSQSLSISPNPTFTSTSSVTYVPNPGKNNSDKDIKKIDSPLIEHSENEQEIFSTNIKESNEIKNTNYDSAVIGNLQTDKQNQQQQQYEYKQNNGYFDPITISIKLWQSYYIIWMNFYLGMLESFNRSTRNI